MMTKVWYTCINENREEYSPCSLKVEMPADSRIAQTDAEAETAVDWLYEAGLAGPAYLLFQSIRPASFLIGQGLLFLHPWLPMERWRRTADLFSQLLSDRSRLETLLFSLESRICDKGISPDQDV